MAYEPQSGFPSLPLHFVFHVEPAVGKQYQEAEESTGCNSITDSPKNPKSTYLPQPTLSFTVQPAQLHQQTRISYVSCKVLPTFTDVRRV